MKDYKVVWTAKAVKQLDKIYDFLAQNSVRTAEKRVLRLLEKIDQLKNFPLMGQEELHLQHLKKGHRYLIEGNYKVVYRKVKWCIFLLFLIPARTRANSKYKLIY